MRRFRVRPFWVLILVAAMAVGGYRWNVHVENRPPDPFAGLMHFSHEQPTPGREEAREPLGKPAPLKSRSDSFAFQYDQLSDKPVTWSPCRPIHYVTRYDNAPPGSPALLADSIAQLSQATGLRFIDDGLTKERPSSVRPAFIPSLYGDRWAPVLITWSTPVEEPRLAGENAGFTRPSVELTPNRKLTYVSGIVVLDAPAIKERIKQKPFLARVALLHELGHVVGLDHVKDRSQVMYERARPFATYQPGDLAGLSRLGQGPCQPDI